MANDNLLDHVGRAAGKCLHDAQTRFQGFQTSIGEAFRGVSKAQGRGISAFRNPLARRSPEPLATDQAVAKNEARREMEPWRRNPAWVDERATLEISVPRGALCQMKSCFKVGLPPKTVYDILIDPENKRVFKDIQEVRHRRVLEDYGHRQIVELEQAAIWRFLWLSGTLSVWVKVEQDRKALSVKYELGKPGFMKRFQGTWNIEPLYVDAQETSPPGRVASIVRLQQVVEPTIMPPPPISWYVRGITRRTMEKMLGDLQAECRRLRETDDDDNEIFPNRLDDDHDTSKNVDPVLLHRYKKIDNGHNQLGSRNRKRRWRKPN